MAEDEEALLVQQQKHNAAYIAAVPHTIQGLYNFQSAATIIRIAHALGELDASVVAAASTKDNDEIGGGGSNEEMLNSFLERLNVVERSFSTNFDNIPPSYAIRGNGKATFQTHVVVVEGLDGSGKSSLVQRLAEMLNNICGGETHAVAMATPTASMSAVRPVFDKRGGPVARAYYMVSNYILQYEIEQLEKSMREKLDQDSSNAPSRLIVVIDRWYTSTVAYSCAWKNTTGGEESIDHLHSQDPSIFAWPKDLRPPDLLFLLQVDDIIRRDRVESRRKQQQTKADSSDADENPFNPWDQRLNDDPELGLRIMSCFERVANGMIQSNSNSNSSTTTKVCRLNGNQSKEDVTRDALYFIQEEIVNQRPTNPLLTFQHQPLECFRWVSAELNLCDLKTGRRLKHAPWAMQLAWDGNGENNSSQSPVLKTVGIHSVDSSGILFFMRKGSSPSGGTVPTSMVWVGGDYPYEQQWRGEGFLVPVMWSECEFLQKLPPPSLVAYTTSCKDHDDTSKLDLEKLNDKAQGLRKCPTPIEQHEDAVHGYRFLPIRMEVLSGGPSSPGGPLRIEWRRGGDAAEKNAGTQYPISGWSRNYPIVPFRLDATSLSLPHFPLKPITIALTGTHCSGKTTLGHKLASILGATFHTELGETMRDKDKLVAGGHRTGDGTASSSCEGGSTTQEQQSWDDRVFQAEVARDEEYPSTATTTTPLRVVETWHVGNLQWAMVRLQNAAKLKDGEGSNPKMLARTKDAISKLLARTKDAISKEMNRRVVLAVHLTMNPEDSSRRRELESGKAKDRIKMESELEEVAELHQMLDVSCQENLRSLQNDLGFPLLVIDNSLDDGMDVTASKIVQFVNENQWRRAF